MVLKGKFTSYNEFFDLIKLVVQMRMTVSLSLANQEVNKELLLSFKEGSLIFIKCSSDDTLLLDFNHSCGKVADLDYVKTSFFSFLVDFRDVSFETVIIENKKLFSVEDFETVFLDVVREFDEIERLPKNVIENISVKEFSSPSEEEVMLVGYLLSGYTLYQSIFSVAKVKEFVKAYESLVGKGIVS